MLKRPTFWFMTLSLCVGMVLFRIKYEVIALEQHNIRVKSDIQLNKSAIHILKAEWTHLNDPKRLQNLSQKYLNALKPVTSIQLITFQDMTSSPKNEPIPKSNEIHNAQSAFDIYVESSLDDTTNDGVRA